jgi:hypothetical protein
LLNNNGIAYDDRFQNNQTKQPIYSHGSPQTHNSNRNQYSLVSEKQQNCLNDNNLTSVHSEYFNNQEFHNENIAANTSNQAIYGDVRSMSRSGLHGSDDSSVKPLQRPSSVRGVHKTISPAQIQRPASAMYKMYREGSSGTGTIAQNQSPSLNMNQSKVAHVNSGSVNAQRLSSIPQTNKTPSNQRPSSTMNPRSKGSSHLPSMSISHRDEPRISSRQSVRGNPNISSARTNPNNYNRFVAENQLNSNQESRGNSNSKDLQPNPFHDPSTFRPSTSSKANYEWNRPKAGGNSSFIIPENHSLSRNG